MPTDRPPAYEHKLRTVLQVVTSAYPFAFLCFTLLRFALERFAPPAYKSRVLRVNDDPTTAGYPT